MDPVIKASLIIGFVALVCAIFVAQDEIRKRRAGSRKDSHLSSFAARHQQVLAEVEALKTAEQRYRDRINAAFNEARESGALIVSEVSYADIETDKFRAKGRHPGDHPKPMLTRIKPVLTQELAERIRDFEVHASYECDTEGLAQIRLDARSLQWRVEEVPARYEPPNLKDEDRITYPDLYAFAWLPESLKHEARRFLGYDDEYVQKQVDALVEKESNGFEVTE
jgi:hypothetical protein